MNYENKLNDLGITLPEAKAPVGNYVATKITGKLLFISGQISINENGPLNNKTFMLTGKLQGMSRAEAKSLIEQNSGVIISNVSKKLDYLVTGEKPTKRKIDAAKELNIKILSQKEWFKMLN